MSLALAQVDTGWTIPNTTFWYLKILPGKVWNISRISFLCKELQSETNYYPGLQDGSSPLERDMGKHSNFHKTPEKKSPFADFWLGSGLERFPFLPCA